MRPTHLRIPILLCAALAFGLLRFAPAAAQPYAPEKLAAMQRVKQIQREMMLEEGREKMKQGREAARAARRHRGTAAGTRARPERRSAEDRYDAVARELAAERSGALPVVEAVAPNVMVNTADPGGSNAAQSEVSLAALGSNVLVAWNDGSGFITGGQKCGYGFSTDGGATFTDGGEIPAPAGSFWTSDPVVTVNEKTGDFYFCGLLDTPSNRNGVGVARGHFTGGGLVWDAVRIAFDLPRTSDFIDKPWVSADSLTGNVYIIYSRFVTGSNTIEFRRSLDRGDTWSTGITMNLPGAAGFVQGARVACGPGGEVYAVWKEIGRIDVDYFRSRRSINAGASFGAEFTVAAIFDNFGTGAPGFNRIRGIAFPAISVDRTNGPNRGRIYCTWNESLDWYDELDNAGSAGNLNESEGNNAPPTADPFGIGQRIVASFGSTSDVDVFSFSAVRGISYLFLAEVTGNQLYNMRVLCKDQITRLTLAGDDELPGSFPSLTVWTCPEDGTYFLRMFYDNRGGSGPGGYTVKTAVTTNSGERGRDSRDIFSASSQDGSSWTAPARVNNDSPWYDNYLPEIAVAGNGDLYSLWYDFRDSPAGTCGGVSHAYMAQSTNNGQNWTQLGAASSVQTNWTNVSSNIIPNMGDYLGLFADGTAVYPSWGDGRLGNPDVFAAPILFSQTPLTVESVVVDTAHIAITWRETADGPVTATVYRREGGGAETALGSITSDIIGTLFFDDTNVNIATQYHYRLGIVESGTERFSGDVDVTTPGGPEGPALAIRSLFPNPARQQFVVSLTLKSDAPATLALHDISGREIERVQLSNSLGAGDHLITFAPTQRLRAGLYALHLTQGGVVRTKRVTVVP